MNKRVHNQIVSFIWSIADDVLRDVFVRGKYRDIILPFTVIRRLDALLVPTKNEVLEANKFLIREKIDDKSGLQQASKYPFWNTSKFTFENLLNDADNIDSNLETYLDGYSPNVQEIISKFKLRNQLETMREAGITYLLIDKFTSKEINLSPFESRNSKGELLPPLTNLGMGYVFEELIRKFNEENNEEAGEHFTPREIIRLMTHILFSPVKNKIQAGTYLVYDPACGSGGMLTESEEYALELSDNRAKLELYGQEVNPETYAICTSDMLIKGRKVENIKYGSTLSNDGFPNLKFDFMLSNPPYGKTWKLDVDAIVTDRGKPSEVIRDSRFQVGLPTISDGQLLFLVNMVSKMKHNTPLGSRIATVHNGSALFTGDAGGGESEIRKNIIENDWLECIIALPKNIFYNTGIPTYVWIISNKKSEQRKGKVQLINALELYSKLRKNLGQKNCELSPAHIEQITDLYLNFTENDISKIFPNEYFGYNKITVERPLRLSSKFTGEAVESLRYENSVRGEMQWAYEHFGDELYDDLKKFKANIESYLTRNEITLSPNAKKKLFSKDVWNYQRKLMLIAERLSEHFGEEQFDDFNEFQKLFSKALKELKIKTDAKDNKAILNAVSWQNEEAEPVIKKVEKDGTIRYEPDPDLRDSENVPLDQNFRDYFEREVLPYWNDAWIDETKTTIGYEIPFVRYFYRYLAPRSVEELSAEILELESKTAGILREIVNSEATLTQNV
jgi:type I restriction enzyme M protein